MWDIHFRTVDARGRERMEFPRIGGTVLGYTVTNAVFRTEERYDPRTDSMRTVDLSEVVIQAPADGEKEGETYTLRAGEQAEERELLVGFVYLDNRPNPQRCTRFQARLGTEFPLRHPSGETQRYRVTALAPQEVVVRRIDPDREPEDFVVKRAVEADFKYYRPGTRVPERERFGPEFPREMR